MKRYCFVLGYGAAVLCVIAMLAGRSSAALVNEALESNGGVASQSSTAFLRPQPGSGPASRAIDGNRNGEYDPPGGGGSVTHTASELEAFWEVQLDGTHTVHNILVFNRTDCCAERVDPFRLTLFDGANPVFQQIVNAFVADIIGANVSGMSFNVGGVAGDRVRLQLHQQTNFLHLAEVEVLADEGTIIPAPAALPAGLVLLGMMGLKRGRRAS